MAHSRVITALFLLSLTSLGIFSGRPSSVAARPDEASSLLISQPVSLAAARSGNVYLLDWSHPHVTKISSNGAVSTEWPVSPTLPPNPGSIAVNRAEHVFVLRNVRHSNVYVGALTEYSATGHALATWYDSRWLNARGLAAGSRGMLYILLPGPQSENTSATVLTVSPAGRVTDTWHLARYGFDYLEGLALATDIHGNLYVAGIAGSCSRDCQGHDADILVQRALSGPKSVRIRTTFVAGPGLAVDSSGAVFTAVGYSLMKFTTTGTMLGRWGSVGCGPLQFRALTGLAIDGQSNLYALDPANKIVEKIRTNGQPEALWGTCPPGAPPTPVRPTPKPTVGPPAG